MPSPNLFFDSSALFAGIISADGASRALLVLAEGDLIAVTVSEQVLTETERALARKVPRALPTFREALRSTGLRIVRNPSPKAVAAHGDIIVHAEDVPIIVAAKQSRVDYLVTLNRRHFIDDPDVAIRAGLRIGLPGDALAWVRERLARRE
jgi:predicted nucleic acid-binding protein